VSVSGVLFSVSACVCDLLIFLPKAVRGGEPLLGHSTAHAGHSFVVCCFTLVFVDEGSGRILHGPHRNKPVMGGELPCRSCLLGPYTHNTHAEPSFVSGEP